MNYLREHRDIKDCTITQMIKPGGVRSVAVSRKFLKKHLSELEERGFVYSRTVQDPIMNTKSTYYTLIPQCKDGGNVGVPEYIVKKLNTYIDIITEFYGELSRIYFPMMRDYCGLCESYKKILNKVTEIDNCFDFYRIFRGCIADTSKELAWLGIRPDKWEELRQKTIDWENEPPTTFLLFLEDLTIALFHWTILYSPLPLCEDCKEYERCLRQGQGWVSKFLSYSLETLPENNLTKFWKSIVSGVPEIRTALLYDHFKDRHSIKEDNHSIDQLRMYGDRRMLPYLYTKAIPFSLAFLVEDILMPCMRELDSIYEKYKKVS